MPQVYIITTKATEFTVLLLAQAQIPIPPQHVYGLEAGPKAHPRRCMHAHHMSVEWCAGVAVGAARD